VQAICADEPTLEYAARAAASACLGITHTALLRWAADNGDADLPDLYREAFTAVFGHAP